MAPMMKRRRDDDSPTRIVKKPKQSGEDMHKEIAKSRKEVRKTMRTLKKMRKDAFMRKKAIPTMESLQKEKEEQERIKNKIKKNRDRQKKKRRNRKIRKMEEQEEKDRKEREVEAVNIHDNKVLKDLEKKLKFKKDRGLPKSFREDSLGYVLDYMDEAKAYMLGQGYESDGDGDDVEGATKLNGIIKKLNEGTNDDDENDDDDEEEFEDDDEEEEESNFEEEDDEGEEMEIDDDDDDDDDDDSDSEGEDDDDEEEDVRKAATQKSKKSVHFDLPKKKTNQEEDDDGDDDEEDGEDDDDEDDDELDGDDDEEDDEEEDGDDDDDDEEDVDKEAELVNKKSIGKSKQESKEDIYGRKLGSNSGDYIPPALRNADSFVGKKNSELNRQALAILNKLSESNMAHSCKEFEQLFKDNSRQSVCSALENGITRLCLTDESCSRLLIVHCCFLVAFLHNQVGTEVSANVLQFVVTKLCSLFEDSSDDSDQEDQEITNCLLLVCQLYDFKIMESVLILDITRRLLKRFFIKDINLISLLLKEIGPRMRKDDPVSFKELLVEIISKTNEVHEEASSMKKLLTKNLVDLLTFLKNNQFNKITSYDPDAFTRRMKLFNSIVKSSAVIPLKVTLEDIEQCETRGKWWLVGSAWSGRDQEASKTSQDSSLGNYAPSIMKMAKAQRMDSGIKMGIFCTMMSAEDNDDAFERLIRLNLNPKQQPEIMHVIIATCLQSVKFNPFYAHLAAKFCKYHRNFTMACKCSLWDKLKLLPGMSNTEAANLTRLLKQLISWGILPLTVLKNVDFTSFDEKTSQLVDRLLRHLLTKCDDFVRIFRVVSYDNSFKVLKLSLDFFIRSFYVERKGVDEELSKRARKALDALNEPPVKVRGQKEAKDDDFYSRIEDNNSGDDD